MVPSFVVSKKYNLNFDVTDNSDSNVVYEKWLWNENFIFNIGRKKSLPFN